MYIHIHIYIFITAPVSKLLPLMGQWDFSEENICQPASSLLFLHKVLLTAILLFRLWLTFQSYQTSPTVCPSHTWFKLFPLR